MARKIEGEGPLSARIFFLGESPWKTEEALGRPFVGASGELQKRWWGQVGLSREEIRIDNVYPFMPPSPAPPGDRLMSVPVGDLVAWMRDLHRRIGELSDPYVIVPTGNYALFALTGKGKVPARVWRELGQDVTATEAEKKVGISKLRGSVYEYVDVKGRRIKVVPTIHPAAVLQRMSWEKRSLVDWRRIKGESLVREREVPRREVTLVEDERTAAAVYQIFQMDKADPPIAMDIETGGGAIPCVGFAGSVDHAFVFPMPSKEERERWMPWVKLICHLKNPFVLQNGLYDWYWLAEWRIEPPVGGWWDTMLMHHLLDPREEHKLEFLASIYTKQPYWKDEAKDEEEIAKFVGGNLEALYHYNGLDCCVPLEIFGVFAREFNEKGLWEFYQEHYQKLAMACLKTMLHGVRVDVKGQKEYAKRLMRECDGLREGLKEAAGEELYAVDREVGWREPSRVEWEQLVEGTKWFQDYTEAKFGHCRDETPKPKYINKTNAKKLGYVMTKGFIKEYKEIPKKDFSRNKLLKFFHETLGAPRKVKRGTKTVTLDEVALRQLAIKHPGKVGTWPLKVVGHREKKKEIGYVKGAWDKDGRIRCSYKLTTEAARLASAKNPMRKGYNLQNVKRGDIRSTFLPDEGCVFVRLDLSQVEHRQVMMYTRQARMVELANLRPEEYDGHVASAQAIFGLGDKEPTYEERYFGKRVTHAAERGLGGDTLSDELLKEEIVMTPKVCQGKIDRWLDANWEIRDHYFPWVRERVIAEGTLTNTWGRTVSFQGERLDHKLYRQAYSWLPQSETADLLNMWGFVPLVEMIEEEGLKSRVNMQVHDEVVVSCPKEEAFSVAAFVVASLERPRLYVEGNALSVPVGVTLGMTWDGGAEFKSLPGVEEFMEKCDEILKG